MATLLSFHSHFNHYYLHIWIPLRLVHLWGCHGYTWVLSIPDLWIFTDWISHSMDISMGIALQSSPPGIFVSSSLFSIIKICIRKLLLRRVLL
jgi:hypothetical protein